MNQLKFAAIAKTTQIYKKSIIPLKVIPSVMRRYLQKQDINAKMLKLFAQIEKSPG